MRNDPKFNNLFVHTVKKHEILYNLNLEDYANKTAQEQAWQEIGEELNCTVKECKDRWRSLRVCFLRELRNKKINGPDSSKKPYYLAAEMSFLIPFIRLREYPYQVAVQSDASTSNSSSLEPTSIFYQERDYEDQLKSKEKKCKIEVDSYSSEEEKEMSALSDSQIFTNPFLLSQEEDSDLQFFKSLLPDLRKLNAKQKRWYKQRALQLFDEVPK